MDDYYPEIPSALRSARSLESAEAMRQATMPSEVLVPNGHERSKQHRRKWAALGDAMQPSVPMPPSAPIKLKDPSQLRVEEEKQPKQVKRYTEIPQNGKRLADVDMVKGLADIINHYSLRLALAACVAWRIRARIQ